tara:strand:- start:1257 stop:2366 length:1110 start_codon:yes stop_codon:yes gene_type:complete
MNRTLKSLLFIFLFLSLGLTACKVGRFFIYNFADINDYKKFPSRPIEKSDKPFYFVKIKEEKIPKTVTIEKEKISFNEFLYNTNTVAFIVIRSDSILYEKYLYGYNESSIVPSFSMAKSFTSILIGCAIDDGLIQSVDDFVTEYLPELKNSGFQKVKIKHLLQMTSGIDFNEGYSNPFGHVATFYYGRNLRKSSSKLKFKSEPGINFEYVSGNTQILGLVLESVLKEQTISKYFESKIWKPLGMEYAASWSIDRKKDGIEKTFCCLNARARDFAKIGRLYLNKGNWNGQQIVSEDWINQSIKKDKTEGSVSFYQYQWWLPKRSGDFMAQGILGQFIYVSPDKDLIFVRLGKKTGNINWGSFLGNLAESY